MTLLAFEHVTKCFPDGIQKIVVLEGASCEIDAGDYIGVWGSRRSGKSTFLRLAAGIELPDEGTVRFADRAISQMSEDARAGLRRRGGIALVGGDWRPPGGHPVLEHVGFGLLSGGVRRRDAEQLARHALDRVDALRCAHMSTERLSLGERVRVELARALVREPRLLLVDEPAILPSPSESRELYALLRSLGKDRALALVVASEDLAPLRGALRIMAIGDGRLRSTDARGKVLPFPDRRVDDAGSGA